MHQVLKDHKVKRVNPDFPVSMDVTVKKVPLVKLVHKALLVLMVKTDKTVNQAWTAKMVSLDKKVNVANQELLPLLVTQYPVKRANLVGTELTVSTDVTVLMVCLVKMVNPVSHDYES